jgi:hypothetical protein
MHFSLVTELTLAELQFLTTYIISLMRSIDIRSEPAVRLLSDFLDVRGSEGRERKGTEHFLHGEFRVSENEMLG